MASLNVVICIFESRMQLQYNHLRRGLRFNITRWESTEVINQSVSFSPDAVEGFLRSLASDSRLLHELLRRDEHLFLLLLTWLITGFLPSICFFLLFLYIKSDSGPIYVHLFLLHVVSECLFTKLHAGHNHSSPSGLSRGPLTPTVVKYLFSCWSWLLEFWN